MDRDEELARAIRQRDVQAAIALVFEVGRPVVKTGFRTEGELWDFKSDCPRPSRDPRSEAAWASIAADVLAFHNQKGGLLLFGIDDGFNFKGATIVLDSKLVNDQLRKFLRDTIWIEYHREFIQADQRYLGVAVVPPRGARLERFRTAAPTVDGVRQFGENWSAIRRGDSTYVLTEEEANALTRDMAAPVVGQAYAVDEPFYRILNPEYGEFIDRPECAAVERALTDPRAAVTSVLGIGGVGKTALATWAVLRAHERGDFAFIVSITAKDRELTSTGIRALTPPLASFENLLDNVLEVLGFPEVRAEPLKAKEEEVRPLLTDSNGLIYVDNLETVDDPRLVPFLDSLPVGTRGLVTSRRSSVRVSVHPVDVGPLSQKEVVAFVASLKMNRELEYVTRLSPAECIRIGEACDGIPLAIRWALARAGSPSAAVDAAERITASGRHGEELLEFCFRRVFDALTEPERAVVETLSLFQRPITTEAILAGSDLLDYKLMDAIEDLVSESLVQRLFDPTQNDYVFALLPMTRAFVYEEVTKQPALESRIRTRLSSWFEAKDVKDASERRVISELRQGKGASELGLLDLAVSAERRGDFSSAEDLYDQALRRNPTSWKAARLFGEFLRHKLDNQARALSMYEQAAANAPARGPDRALIYREWGMLLRDSGDPDATDRAIEKFEIALTETPNDPVAIHALAHMLGRKGAHLRVIELLEPLAAKGSPKQKKMSLPLLASAYTAVGDLLKKAEANAQLDRLRDQYPELDWRD